MRAIRVARGFLTGTFWGLFTGSLVAAGGSLYVGVSKSSLPDMTQVEVPAGSGFNGSRQDKAIVVAPQMEAPERPVAPTVQAPQPESLSLSDASMETAQAPSVITTPSLSEMVPSVKNDTGLASPMDKWKSLLQAMTNWCTTRFLSQSLRWQSRLSTTWSLEVEFHLRTAVP